MHALGLEFDSAAQLSKRPGSVWNCLWGHGLKRSPGIIRKSRVSYPGPGFLSSATWPSLPKKHYNGLNQTIIRLMQKPDTLSECRHRFSYIVVFFTKGRIHNITNLWSRPFEKNTNILPLYTERKLSRSLS